MISKERRGYFLFVFSTAAIFTGLFLLAVLFISYLAREVLPLFFVTVVFIYCASAWVISKSVEEPKPDEDVVKHPR